MRFFLQPDTRLGTAVSLGVAITCMVATSPLLAQDAPDPADRQVFFGEQAFCG